MGHKRQHLLLAPLVLLPPGPQTFPLEVVMLGITSAVVLLLPFLEVPSSFLGSVSLLCDKAQFAITTCVTLPPTPPGLSLPDQSHCNNYDSYLWSYSHNDRTIFMLLFLSEKWRAMVLLVRAINSNNTIEPYLEGCFLAEACCAPFSVKVSPPVSLPP